jgi:type I restriction enzyme S subunit
MQTVLLGDLINISSGKARPKESGEFPVYGGNGIFDSAPITNVKEPAVIVGRVGAYCGSVYIEASPFWLSDNALGVTAKKDVDLGYIYYLLKSIDLNKMSVGGAQPLITQGILNKISVTVPDLETQKKIADVLRTIDEKIELNRKMNETLEQMGQALFKKFFIANPEANKWVNASIYDVANVINGAPFSSKLFKEVGEGKPLIRIRDLKSQDPKIWTTEEHRKGRLVVPGDIIAGMDAEFRPIVWSSDSAWLNQRVCLFEPKKPYVSKLFLLETIRPQLKFYENTKIGTTVIHLSKTDIDRFTYIVAPNSIMLNFKELTDSLFDQQVTNAQEIQNLVTLRDTLLHQLIYGKIKL